MPCILQEIFDGTLQHFTPSPLPHSGHFLRDPRLPFCSAFICSIVNLSAQRRLTFRLCLHKLFPGVCSIGWRRYSGTLSRIEKTFVRWPHQVAWRMTLLHLVPFALSNRVRLVLRGNPNMRAHTHAYFEWNTLSKLVKSEEERDPALMRSRARLCL